MLKSKKAKNALAIDIVYEEKISRLFIFRFLWIPVVIIPIAAYSAWFALFAIVQFVHMLFLGKRSKSIFDRQLHYVRYVYGWQAYLRYFINTHPVILPWRG